MLELNMDQINEDVHWMLALDLRLQRERILEYLLQDFSPFFNLFVREKRMRSSTLTYRVRAIVKFTSQRIYPLQIVQCVIK